MTSLFALAAAVFGSFFRGKRTLVLENLALRQQLAVYKRAQNRPRLRSTDRAFWVWLSKFWDGWRTPLLLVRPETHRGEQKWRTFVQNHSHELYPAIS